MKELRRLKFRFVLFNMILVTAVLVLALAGGTVLIRRQVQRDGMEALERAALQDPVETIFELNAYTRIPYFTVVVETDGEVILMDGIYNSFQGEEFLEQVAEQVELSGLESGELEDYHLRFRRVILPTGCLFAFVDTSYEASVQEHMTESLHLICGGIWLCLLVVSCIFANWAVKPAEESLQRQKQFVADVSHELKTPLTVIAANAELLAEPCEQLSADTGKWIRSISGECQEMRTLVEHMLALAKADLQQKRKRCRATCALGELAEEEALTFEAVFFQKGKYITYQVDDAVRVYGEEGEVRKLLGILLDNAAKYSETGKTTEVSVKRMGGKRVRLEVKSPGKPIPEGERKAVFRRFYRCDRARSSGQGYGLGLAIAEELAAHCGARIGLEPEPDGNCFYVVFRCCSEWSEQ